jgi:hypothetical protein
MHDSRDLDTIFKRPKEHDVVSYAERTTAGHTKSRSFFARHGMAGNRIAFLTDRLHPTPRSLWLVASDVRCDVNKVLVGPRRRQASRLLSGSSRGIRFVFDFPDSFLCSRIDRVRRNSQPGIELIEPYADLLT